MRQRTKWKGGACIYTDGSGFEGGVGVAAVVVKGGEVKAIRRRHLGDKDKHTMFEGQGLWSHSCS